MKVRELIERSKTLYSKGAPSDDVRLSNRYIYSKIVGQASWLIRRDLDRKRDISPYSYTHLSCIEMMCAELHECPCLPPVGKKFWRSKFKLPEIINSKHGLAVLQVATLSNDIEYNHTPIDQIKYIKGQRFTKEKERYFFKDDYLFVLQSQDREMLSISALFANPYELLQFQITTNCIECSDCTLYNPLDVEFSLIEDSRTEELIERVNQEVVAQFASVTEDIENDHQDRTS